MFRAKRAERVKLVFWDGTGLCLFVKRLEDGIFRWPKIADGVMPIGGAILSIARRSRLAGVSTRDARRGRQRKRCWRSV
ncbi:transposase [Bradyrhizobium sp. USDA 4354]